MMASSLRLGYVHVEQYSLTSRSWREVVKATLPSTTSSWQQQQQQMGMQHRPLRCVIITHKHGKVLEILLAFGGLTTAFGGLTPDAARGSRRLRPDDRLRRPDA